VRFFDVRVQQSSPGQLDTYVSFGSDKFIGASVQDILIDVIFFGSKYQTQGNHRSEVLPLREYGALFIRRMEPGQPNPSTHDQQSSGQLAIVRHMWSAACTARE
jgi:hypothetical protein